MDKVYEPGQIEQRLYRDWEAQAVSRPPPRACPTAS